MTSPSRRKLQTTQLSIRQLTRFSRFVIPAIACLCFVPTNSHADGFFSSLFRKSKAVRPKTSASADSAGRARITSRPVFRAQSRTAPANTRMPARTAVYPNAAGQTSRYSVPPKQLRQPGQQSVRPQPGLENPFSDDYANKKVLGRLLPSLKPVPTKQRQPIQNRQRIQQVRSRESWPAVQRFVQLDPPDDENTDEGGEGKQEGEDTEGNANENDENGDTEPEPDPEPELELEDEQDARFDRSRSISGIVPSLDYAYKDIDTDDLPEDKAIFTEGVYQPRQMPARQVHWLASNLHHNPLYFEDPALERYGHTHNDYVQPFVSAGRFVTQTVGIPYQMAIDPPWTARSTLGWYRPGECAPRLKYRIPVNGKGVATELMTLAALVLIIP